MEKTIYECEGNIQRIAKHYGVSQPIIHFFLASYPQLTESLNKARLFRGDSDIDNAETVMRYCLSLAEVNPKIAQDTAKFILDKKGAKRGWGDSREADAQTKAKSQLQDLSEWAKKAYDELEDA